MIYKKLSQRIFWDVDPHDLDEIENRRFIVERVITRGTLEDWKEIKKFYGLENIKNEILSIRNLDIKTLNFFSSYFEIDKKYFRCYSSKQLSQTPFHY